MVYIIYLKRKGLYYLPRKALEESALSIIHIYLFINISHGAHILEIEPESLQEFILLPSLLAKSKSASWLNGHCWSTAAAAATAASKHSVRV